MTILVCLTDFGGAVSLCFEKEETNLLKNRPRSISNEKLVDFKNLVHGYLVTGGYYSVNLVSIPFWVLFLSFGDYHGYDSQLIAQTFTLLVTMQMVNLFAVRNRVSSSAINTPEYNTLLFVSNARSTTITVLVNNYRPIQNILGTRAVPWAYCFLGFSFGLLWLFCEMRKHFTRQHPGSSFANLAWWFPPCTADKWLFNGPVNGCSARTTTAPDLGGRKLCDFFSCVTWGNFRICGKTCANANRRPGKTALIAVDIFGMIQPSSSAKRLMWRTGCWVHPGAQLWAPGATHCRTNLYLTISRLSA